MRNLKIKLEQLTMNARCTPTNVGGLHLTNELSKISVETRPSDTTTFSRLIPPETFPLPSDNLVRMQR